MITSVFFSFRQKGEVLVIPVATLFAFTQLRQTMPGAPPGFGMYQLLSLLDVMLMSILLFKVTSLTLLVSFPA